MPENLYNLPRGTVCVARGYQGALVALAIPQTQLREWCGCFSII